MAQSIWHELISGMIVRGIAFDAGLTEPELVAVESRFRFQFPPDLRTFLGTMLPRGERFPDWRSGSEPALRDWLDFPRQGILFDIEFNQFWLEEWGPLPHSLAEGKRVASDLIAAAPKLIPIYGHRMIPDDPHLPGNPVFSVHQTDIIHYGSDLADYLRSEFQLGGLRSGPDQIREIRFWNLDRFQNARWATGSCVFDNTKGTLP